jgi:proteasome lid subunit RPN8/RPN11
LIAAGCSWFGVIHSPPGPSAIAWPSDVARQLPEVARWQTPYHIALAYVLMAGAVLALGAVRQNPDTPIGDIPSKAD